MEVNGYTIEPEANLKGVNLSRTDLSRADLRGANLTGADLSHANIVEADFSRADLSGADLSGVDGAGGSFGTAPGEFRFGPSFQRANLSGTDLSGADLSEADLTGANLSGVDLRGANLTGADLTFTILSGANLSGVDLSKANLTGTDLSKANLSGANLSEANLDGVELTEANLTGADLSKANLDGVNFVNADLSGAYLSGAYLSGDFYKANLTGANLTETTHGFVKNLSWEHLPGIDLTGAEFRYTDLSGEDLSGANLSGANFFYRDLSGANLSGTDLSKAYLSGANLSGTDLSKANLSGANLFTANLSEANLKGAFVAGEGADLRGANLSGANLSAAELSGTDFYRSDLSGANLSGTDLSKAYLSGADLRGANLTGANFSEAKLFETQWPEGFSPVVVEQGQRFDPSPTARTAPKNPEVKPRKAASVAEPAARPKTQRAKTTPPTKATTKRPAKPAPKRKAKAGSSRAQGCPKCGGPMVERTNRSDNSKFLSCEDFPDCRGTRNVDGRPGRSGSTPDFVGRTTTEPVAPCSSSLPKALSPTSAVDFMRCPRLFYEKQVSKKVKSVGTEAKTKGTLAHAAFDKVFDLAPSRRTPAAAAGFVRPLWDEMRGQDEQEAVAALPKRQIDAMLKETEVAVRNWFNLEDPKGFTPLDREMTVEAALNRAPMRGIIDRVDDLGDGRVAIVDYKTGKQPPKKRFKEEALLPIRIYAAAMSTQSGITVDEVRLLYVSPAHQGEIREPVTRESVAETKRQFASIWKEIKDAARQGRFESRTNPLCDWCDAKPICPAWT